MSSDRGSTFQLSWLRGCAALLVVVSHFIRATEFNYYSGAKEDVSFILKLGDLGTFGVALFFCLSGCTLCLSDKGEGYVSFVLRRFFRIWPAFFVALLFYLVFCAFFSEWYQGVAEGWLYKQFGSEVSYQDVLKYLLLVSNVFGPSEIINGAFWSLPVEFQYYLLFPVALLVIKRFSVVGAFAMSIAFYIIYVFGLVDMYDDIVFRLAFVFLGGIWIGYFYKQSDFRVSFYGGLVICLCAGGGAVLVRYDYASLIGYHEDWALLSLLVVYVLLITDCSCVKNTMVARFFGIVGEMSYSLYLYHNLVVGLVVMFWFQYLGKSEIGVGVFGITVMLSLVVSYFSYKLVEKPSIIFGKLLVSGGVRSVQKY